MLGVFFMKRKQILDKITKIAIFSALSYILYFVPKFPLPFFPSFLEVNFSLLPALLSGFALGPIGGSIVVLIRFVLKLPFTHTQGVGELADLLIGLGVILSSSLVYLKNKTKKGGTLALVIGSLTWVFMGIITNYFINIPFYINAFFGGNLEPLLGMLQKVIPSVTSENYMIKYILFAVIPFNLLLSVTCSVVTFFVYKRISDIFKKDFFK